jgi:hypothetical protein
MYQPVHLPNSLCFRLTLSWYRVPAHAS